MMAKMLAIYLNTAKGETQEAIWQNAILRS